MNQLISYLDHDTATTVPLSETDIAKARQLETDANIPFHQALLRIGAVSEDRLNTALGKWLKAEIISSVPLDKTHYEKARQVLGLSRQWLDAMGGAIWTKNDKIICIARDITNAQFRETLEIASVGQRVALKYCLTTSSLLEQALSFNRIAKSEAIDDLDDAARLLELAEEAPAIDFVNRMFAHALKVNASDIHIEPAEKTFNVRYRIDGVLRDGDGKSMTQFDAVTTRIKLLSKMDIAERRLPQDGRQTIRFGGEEIDLRVSSLPSSQGESLVLRLLRKDTNLQTMTSLGLSTHARIVLDRLLSYPNGVILVTGPTGSGKSTTLYHALQGLNNGIRKIITIEDPVEYHMPGVVQIPVNASIGYTFSRGLRAILRQDPDVIMLGEIRDGETATIAAQAALTGHLVLSTLHTNSALAAVARLIDIGLEPYLVASSVRGFAAQRLVRRICEDCAVTDEILNRDDTLDPIKSGPANWRKAVGCPKCDNTGYKGRVAIFEIVEIDEALSQAIFEGANLQALTRIAKDAGFQTLFEDGRLKARSGVTTLEEVYRICGQPT